MSMVFFIGMPGSGKSFWGEQLAKMHKIRFIDMDSILEQKEQKSINELFTLIGEQGFRKKEAELLDEIIENNSENTIVACGGGTPCFYDNLEKMKQKGCVVYLETPLSLLAERLKNDTSKRPLLSGEITVDDLQKLLIKRAEFYQKAHFTLGAATISLTTFEQIILSCISRQ